jgi:glucose-1-phosphate cytidylyltransferase
MKVVLLAGGFGTRLGEETVSRPKPMVEIGGMPILWHIMKSYAHQGFNEFAVALGYKGEVIKRYFRDYHSLASDLSVNLKTGAIETRTREVEDWTVHLCDTGADVMTGGRVKRLERQLAGEPFMLTYGDGVSNVDVQALLKFHKSHGKIATVTAVRPPARFGGLVFEGDRVVEFTEKPQIGEGWINGGFMVFQPEVFRYLTGDSCILEADALEELARDGQLMAYKHQEFWQCMDTVRDLNVLEALWKGGTPPWRVWAP